MVSVCAVSVFSDELHLSVDLTEMKIDSSLQDSRRRLLVDRHWCLPRHWLSLSDHDIL